MGLPPRLSNGLGSGLAARLVGAVLGFSNWLSSLPSPTSLRPEISRRLRGRREDEEAGVELVRTSLACIAGDTDYASAAEAAALIAWLPWVAEADCCCLFRGAAGHDFVGSAIAGAVVVSYSMSGIGRAISHVKLTVQLSTSGAARASTPRSRLHPAPFLRGGGVISRSTVGAIRPICSRQRRIAMVTAIT